MNSTDTMDATVWPISRRVVFRFFFIYLLLYMAPWTWLDSVPGVMTVTKYHYSLVDAAVDAGNRYVFHVREQLVPVNGSGDTSYAWAQLWLCLCVAALGCLVWSILDRKRESYGKLDYWLRTFVRYYVAMYALSYGIIKVFAAQMVFPNLSQLLTPLGDFLPMRFSWLFIGYSTPYQVFAGVMEVMVGLLLLNRRTTTLGLLLGIGVFGHVVVLNLCYDIPVKLFSSHLALFCIFLLAYDSRRLYTLLILNKPVAGNEWYNFRYEQRWLKTGRIVTKLGFVILTVIMPLYSAWGFYQMNQEKPLPKPLSGIYDVQIFRVNQDTLPALTFDSLRWKDMIFEKGGLGSVGSKDTLFRQRYGRGYFNFKTDTVTHLITLTITKPPTDYKLEVPVHYEIMNDNAVLLRTKIKEDSLQVRLVKSKRHFQLAEKQFHWLSEWNR